MPTFSVTTRGKVTLTQEVLEHFGIKPGDKVELTLLPEGKATLKAIQPSGTIDAFFGQPANQTTKVATLEEIEEATAVGWAGER